MSSNTSLSVSNSIFNDVKHPYSIDETLIEQEGYYKGMMDRLNNKIPLYDNWNIICGNAYIYGYIEGYTSNEKLKYYY